MSEWEKYNYHRTNYPDWVITGEYTPLKLAWGEKVAGYAVLVVVLLGIGYYSYIEHYLNQREILKTIK